MLKVTEVCMCIKNSRFPKKPSKEKGLCTCPPYGLSVTWGGLNYRSELDDYLRKVLFWRNPKPVFLYNPRPPRDLTDSFKLKTSWREREVRALRCTRPTTN